ncbi:MAG: SMR family transporter [Pseudomonadota bacterium]
MGYLLLAIALTLNAAANILLKIGASHFGGLDEPGLIGRVLANYPLMGGLALFALNVVFYAAALVKLDLSIAYPVMTAGGIVIVVTVSALFLSETLSSAQLLGLGFMVVGIVLVTRGAIA